MTPNNLSEIQATPTKMTPLTVGSFHGVGNKTYFTHVITDVILFLGSPLSLFFICKARFIGIRGSVGLLSPRNNSHIIHRNSSCICPVSRPVSRLPSGVPGPVRCPMSCVPSRVLCTAYRSHMYCRVATQQKQTLGIEPRILPVLGGPSFLFLHVVIFCENMAV